MELIINKESVIVTKKRIKNMYLVVKRPSGQICISAPYGVTEKAIANFINSKWDWILNRKAYVTQYVEKHPAIKFINGQQIPLFGQYYELLLDNFKNKNEITISGNSIIMSYKSGMSDEQKLALLNKFYKKVLENEIGNKLPIWENKLNLHSTSWSIRDMKTRWGTCNTKTKKILFNLQLAKKPLECLDYIIIHELGHIIIHNHGTDFKEYMNNSYPNWKQVKKLLNN